jgi:vacuolar protein sorting-associated protein 13A/C
MNEIVLCDFYVSHLGAQEKGIEGFFKGLGKGLMGLITKPTGGTVDMVSIALDGIRR